MKVDINEIKYEIDILEDRIIKIKKEIYDLEDNLDEDFHRNKIDPYKHGYYDSFRRLDRELMESNFGVLRLEIQLLKEEK
ncbi:hypothetical protein [Bathymodiolus japonicus methanotrophic gill symbiont]|uniref:hypothetical protein n=1 Tax=Bathymodiolus japonicus methanotrophic gill symbiont TaxID=113269 RepID=UPI001C8EBD56|nr:hypothetical protein [Bathymodiolus japonicus methanotrophic gill symbiont]